MQVKKYKNLVRKFKLISFCFFYGYICYSQTGIITTLNNGSRNFTCNNLGNGSSVSNASFNTPIALATDSKGNIYVSDHFTPSVRRIDTNGVITNFAGCGACQPDSIACGEGGLATNAIYRGSSGITCDRRGNVYITTSYENVVFKVDSNGIFSLFAGNGYGAGPPYGTLGGSSPYGGDSGLAINASLADPTSIAVDIAGNVYIADSYNYRVRMVDTTGIITTVAGNGVSGYNGDSALATNAEISANSVLIDAVGNLYIGGNNIVRKVDATTKIITTVAGNGTSGYTGDNSYATHATLNGIIAGMAFDTFGNLYITDYNNNVIRKIDNTSGIITTIAGNGIEGYSGDNGQAINATFSGLCGLTFDKKGNLYVADELNYVIRKINDATALNGIAKLTKENNYTIYPNPNNGSFIIETNSSEQQAMQIFDITGKMVLNQNINGKANIDSSDLDNGVYFVQVKTKENISTQKIIVQH